MKNWLPYLTIILLIVILILQEKTNRYEKEKHLKQQNDLTIKLDSIGRELNRSRLERDHYYLIADSLLHYSEAIKLDLDKANNKLRGIPGRYKYVPVDSLSKLMDKRAADAR